MESQGSVRQKGRPEMSKRQIAKATAHVGDIARNEFPNFKPGDVVSFEQMLDILHVVDVHRQRVENSRADSRNGWRLVMLVQTIAVWVATTFTLQMIAPGLVKFSAVIPLAFDLAVTGWNKHRKV